MFESKLASAWIENEFLRLEYLTTTGPRIVGLYAREHECNLLAETPNIHWETPHGEYFLRGGHRLWTAPENPFYTCPEEGLSVIEENDSVTLKGWVDAACLEKEITIRLEDNRVHLSHRITWHGGYSIQILTKEQYSVERDIPLLGQEEIGRKYPIIGAEIAARLAQRELERQKLRGDGPQLGPTKMTVVGSAGELYRVVHVGEDYLLLQKDESKSSRFVLNAAAISSIRWYSGPSYHSQNSVLRGNPTDTGTNPTSGGDSAGRAWAKHQIDKYDKNGDGRIAHGECLGDYQADLVMPAGAAKLGLPVRWATVNWNPEGHMPPAPPVWSAAHFDFHFFMVEPAVIQGIRTGPCAEFIHCEDSARAAIPLPARHVPPDYLDVGAAVAAMGNHLVDVKDPEIADPSLGFSSTFIYGAYDGKLIFLEPMVSYKLLSSRPQHCRPVRAPEAYAVGGYYPASYCVRHDAATGTYRVTLEGLVRREAA